MRLEFYSRYVGMAATALLLMGGGRDASAQFAERALEVGVNHESSEFAFIGGGVAIFDMDNDDLLDLFFTGGLLVDQLYRNNGSGFDRIINYLWPEDFDYYDYSVSGVAAGDVNNDGFDDLLLCTYLQHENLLLINNGDYTFDVIPPDSSGISGVYWSVGASFGDVNSDGLLDIFIQNYIEEQDAHWDPVTGEVSYDHIGYSNKLYINLGNAQFEDRSAAYGVDVRGNSLTSCFSDYDGDGDLDLYVVNDFGAYTLPNELYRNDHPGGLFTDVGAGSHMDIGLFGMGVAVGDYDGDLDQDYYVTNIGKNALMRNNGDGTFSDVTDIAGVGDSASVNGLTVGWGTGFFDYDNDGDLDLYAVNGHINAVPLYANPYAIPDALYRNLGGGRFEDVDEELGFGDPSVFRGSAYGDLDNDGLLDVVKVVTNRGSDPPAPGLLRRAAIYYNEEASPGNWVKFRLHGTVSNRSAYGAKVFLYTPDGTVRFRECDGGSSHASSNSPNIHFGTGPAAAVDSAVIIWPSGLRQAVRAPETGMLHHVTEGNAVVSAVDKAASAAKFSVFPNPAVDEIRLGLNTASGAGSVTYRIIDLRGCTLSSGGMEEGGMGISISGWMPGIYIITVRDGEKFLGASRIIKLN